MAASITIAGDTYTGQQIRSASMTLVQSLSGSELAYNVAKAVIDLGQLRPTKLVPKGSGGMMTKDGLAVHLAPYQMVKTAPSPAYRYGAECYFHHDGQLIDKMYLAGAPKKVGLYQYQFDFISPIGLLAATRHYGGVYTGQPLTDVLTSIIGGTVPFSVAPELAKVPVFSALPIASRRDNLHQLLLALGIVAARGKKGDLLFAPASADIYQRIPPSRVYQGGGVKPADTITKVVVQEHSYDKTPLDKLDTLYSGTVEARQVDSPLGQSITGDLVQFSAPHYGLAAEGTTILEQGANYAVLAPGPSCVLTGKAYTHTTRQVSRPGITTLADPPLEKKEITIGGATLVSLANSELVADRVYSFYSSAKSVTCDILVGTERPGTPVELVDPFGDKTKGIIQQMELLDADLFRAKVEIIADYTPSEAGNYYTHAKVLYFEQDFTIPADRVRVVLIGGGQGGSSGGKGQDSAGTFSSGDGLGGQPGPGGVGGKIFVSTISGMEGRTLHFTPGPGGLGGICQDQGHTPGQPGGDTTLGDLSSADGAPSSAGFTDLFGGGLYALPGATGPHPGGDGGGSKGKAPTITVDGVVYKQGPEGRDKTSSRFGKAYGGQGGGPAAGRDGEAGGDAYLNQSSVSGTVGIIGGRGGKGADALPPPDASAPGAGGTGGNGGGGGGTPGGVSKKTDTSFPGSEGEGGLGSPGARGGPGIGIIYY